MPLHLDLPTFIATWRSSGAAPLGSTPSTPAQCSMSRRPRRLLPKTVPMSLCRSIVTVDAITAGLLLGGI